MLKSEPSGFEVFCPFRVNSLLVNLGGSSIISAKYEGQEVSPSKVVIGSKSGGITQKDDGS